MSSPRRFATAATFLVALLLGGTRVAHSEPKQGDFELRLGNTSSGLLGTLSPSGLESVRPSSGSSLTLFGINTGFGYFVSDQIELGLQLDLGYIDDGSSQTMFGFAPFLKALFVKERLGFYFHVAPGLAHVSGSGGSGQSALDLNVGLGLEAFVTPHWSIRVGPKYELIKGSGDVTHVVGASWGISAYF